MFALAPFVPTARNVVFIPGTVDRPVAANGMGVLVLMLDRLAGWADDLGFCCIVWNTTFDPVLANVKSHREQEVGWSCRDLGDLFFLYGWRTGASIGFAGKRVHEHRQEVDSRFVYHQRLLPSIVVRFKSNVLLSSHNEAVTAN